MSYSFGTIGYEYYSLNKQIDQLIISDVDRATKMEGQIETISKVNQTVSEVLSEMELEIKLN